MSKSNGVENLERKKFNFKGLDLKDMEDYVEFNRAWENNKTKCAQNYNKCNTKQLQMSCKIMGLTTTGNKHQLAAHMVYKVRDSIFFEPEYKDSNKNPKSNEIEEPEGNVATSSAPEDLDLGGKRPAGKSILPSQHTEELTERIKTLVRFMADEVSLLPYSSFACATFLKPHYAFQEQMIGNHVFGK